MAEPNTQHSVPDTRYSRPIPNILCHTPNIRRKFKKTKNLANILGHATPNPRALGEQDEPRCCAQWGTCQVCGGGDHNPLDPQLSSWGRSWSLKDSRTNCRKSLRTGNNMYEVAQWGGLKILDERIESKGIAG